MHCSVVFAVTLRLLVINIYSSSSVINTWPVVALAARCEATYRLWIAFDASVTGCSRRNIAMPFGTEKLEWLGYPTVKTFRRYLYSFWQNVRTWQSHRQTDTGRACIASRGKYYKNLAIANRSHVSCAHNMSRAFMITPWHWNRGWMSLNAIETIAIRKLGCGILFAFYSNCGRICSRLWDI